MIRKLLFAILLIALFVFVWVFSDPMNRLYLKENPIVVSSGRVLDFSIGDSRDDVERKLASRFEPIELTAPDSCHGIIIENPDDFQMYADRSIRNGVICVWYKDDRLTTISVWFMGPYI
jgi:hypothetical protein